MPTSTRFRILTTFIGCALFVAVTAGVASAGPVYSCPASSPECSGQTFALWIDDVGAGFFDIALSIDTTGYSGSADDLASGVEFQNVIAPDGVYTGLSLVTAPGGAGSWAVGTTELSPGCAGGNQVDSGCAVWAQLSGGGFDFAIGDILTWVFRVQTNAAIDWAGGYIKYAYVDGEGNGVAGLLAENIALQDCQGCSTSERLPNDLPSRVPEPGSLALVGLALMTSALRRRRTQVVR